MNYNKKHHVVDREKTGEKIYTLMQENDISIKDMGRMLRISPAAMYKIIHGECLPTIGHLFTIASVLGITVDDLVIVRPEYRKKPAIPEA